MPSHGENNCQAILMTYVKVRIWHRLCRPALHIYDWVQTALRGLVTLQDTLSNSVYQYLQAFKQKDLVQVSHL